MADCRAGVLLLALVTVSAGQDETPPWPKIDLRGHHCDMSSAYPTFNNNCSTAINGKTNRVYSEGNCIHTDTDDRTPFWWVDLGQTYTVHRIIIYSRGGQEHRMSNLHVFVDQQNVYNSPTSTTVNDQSYAKVVIDVNPQPVTGQLVNITRNASDDQYFINICEVEVYGTPCHENWARPSCSDCESGWWGSECDRQCPAQCAVQCDRNNGSCSQCNSHFQTTSCADCEVGWWGSECDRQCPAQCAVQCDRNNGSCTRCNNHFQTPNCTDCERGWWGSECNQTCPAQCAVQCNRTSGSCTQCNNHFQTPACIECKRDWWGTNCSQQCPKYCTVQCERNNGSCAQCNNSFAEPNCADCESGWWGSECDRQCPAQCAVQCDRNNGSCSQCNNHFQTTSCADCEVGWWGSECDRQCPAQCAVQCDRNNGSCTRCNNHFQTPNCTDCQPQWYGDNCTDQCHDTRCTDCDRRRGCLNCSENFAAPNCTACLPGWWGASNCSFSCTNCGGDGSCDITDGECTLDCINGWKGKTCAEKLTADSSSNVAGLACGAAVGIIAIIVIIVIVVIIVRRRRQNSKEDQRGEEMNREAEPSSSRAVPLSDIAPPKSAKGSMHTKPSVPVKPMKRTEAGVEESTSSHLYGNTPPDTGSKPAAKQGQPPPATAPKPRAVRGAGNVYENVSLPAEGGQQAADAKSKPIRTDAGSRRAGASGGDATNLYEDDDDPYNTEDLYAGMYKNTSVSLDRLQQYLIHALASGELNEQFQNFAKGMKLPHEDGMTDENVRKNRFKNMCAYDFNRVRLHRPKGDPESDYINASYIKGCRGDRQYIATQGPRDNTVGDLWWMVWQEQATQIVMLTRLIEEGKDKCEEYWPPAGKTKTYGHVTVRALEVEERADYVIRTFILKVRGGVFERAVTQYHYNTWPDHGVPQAAALVDFWRYVKARGNPDVPLIVHCSAGVGRTGTYIALDIAAEREAAGLKVNVQDIVTELREQRCIMVQSESQYKFLHEVILEAHNSKDSRISMEQFEQIFPEPISAHTQHDHIDKEFKMLHEMGKNAPKTAVTTIAEEEENKSKNRKQDVLPDDKHVVYLTTHVRGRNQYINAVYLSSLQHRRRLVLTQLPIPDNTLVDFWRMVDGCDVKTIVSLGSKREKQTVKDFCQYWPLIAGEPVTTGPYSIKMKGYNEINEDLTYFTLTQRNTMASKEHVVQLLHYKAWTGEVPEETSTLMQLVDTLKDLAEKDKTGSPTIIQCLDGASKSGLFCAIYDTTNRLTSDAEMDAYLTARHVQAVRPQAIAGEMQYRFLYQIAQEYINNRNIYQNT